MKYKIIKNRKLVQDEDFAGYNRENRAEKLEFEIPENLRNYAITINFETEDEKFYDILDEDYTYTLKNNVTKYNFVNFYLKFMKQLDEVTYEIVKTEVKRLRIRSSFETEEEIPEEEISIIDTLIAQTNSAINRANAISQDLENKVATDYYRGATGVKGDTGSAGADAKINGKNAIEIEAGNNITIEDTEKGIKINSTGGGSGGTSDYTDLTNKPSINNVTLNGNKSLNDLGIQPSGNYALESDIPDVSDFITNTVDDLVNYYKKTETFTKQEVNNLISAITTMDIQVVQTLPVQDISTTTIYLVPKTTSETNDVYDEYIYVSNSWEHIGSTEVDLTDCVKNTDYPENGKSGVIKVGASYGTGVSSTGHLIGSIRTYAIYSTAGDYMLISKGTLENALTGKGLKPIVELTQAEYDALTTKDSNTYYYIVEE